MGSFVRMPGNHLVRCWGEGFLSQPGIEPSFFCMRRNLLCTIIFPQASQGYYQSDFIVRHIEGLFIHIRRMGGIAF